MTVRNIKCRSNLVSRESVLESTQWLLKFSFQASSKVKFH